MNLMKKNFLKFIAISGLFSLFFSFPLATPGIINQFDFESFTLVSLVILSALSYLIFLAGFVYLGKKTQNTLMIVSSCFLILISVFNDFTIFLSQTSTKWSIFFDQPSRIISFGIIFGLVGILHGISLLKLEKQLGSIAKKTGWVEMIFGFSLLTLVLSPIAILLIIPLYILEIMLLLKANKVRI